jgi:hypothetical protein
MRPPSTPNLPKFANGLESELNGVSRRWLELLSREVDWGTAEEELERDEESWLRWIGGDGGVEYSLFARKWTRGEFRFDGRASE